MLAKRSNERKKERIRIPFIASPIHVFSLPRSLLPPSGKDTHSPEISVILCIHLPPIGTKKRKISLNNQHTQEKEKDKILQWPSPVSFFFVERFHLRNFFLIFLAGCRTSFYDRNFSLSLSLPPSPLRLGSVIPAASHSNKNEKIIITYTSAWTRILCPFIQWWTQKFDYSIYIFHTATRKFINSYLKKRERPHVDTFDDEPAGQRQIETKEKQDNLPRKNLHETAGHQMSTYIQFQCCYIPISL